ncbi:hypothetical protein CYMTET_2556 [Cymbomonas tetramitiformis]|uniref:Uncharacterized protein n=1 Tax=Cymbomonas tetramitiformis TaxID=36881 RepID=A0AAE0LLX9_9CHLO|nr:hypothetical protein CYMTET_2556 [Cymbomonas tetramitiformis]
MVDRSKAVAADKAGGGILQEEVAARQGSPPMAMTFWIVLQGFAGDLEYNKEHDGVTETITNAQAAQVEEEPGSSEAAPVPEKKLYHLCL